MYVVAGVSGHVGSVVADRVLGKGEAVRVIVRDEQKGEPWAKRGAQVAVGSLSDAAFLQGALLGATGFFTLLPPDFSAAHVLTAQQKVADAIASAVKGSGVPHVVLLSSAGAELEEGTGPIRGLHYLERKLRDTGTRLTAIRAGYFQENVANSLGAAKAHGILPNFTASADYPMPMIATKDIGAVAADALLSSGSKSEVVDVQGPAYSMRQVAEKLQAALGKPIQIVDIPPAKHVSAMTEAGLPLPWAECFAEMYAAFAAGRVRPVGDRTVAGKTTLDEVLRTLL